MLGEFNKKEFAYLLKKALGNRSAYVYERECGVSRNHISLLLNEKRETAPNWDTIKKLASKAANGVTYNQFMITAGLMADPNEALTVGNAIHSELDSGQTKRFRDIAPPGMAQEFEDLGFELLSLVKDNNMTVDELRDLLVMLRALQLRK